MNVQPPYPPPPPFNTVLQNIEHLRLLSIFYYVMGGMGALFSLIPVFHVAMGIAVVAGGMPSAPGSGPPAAFGWFFIAIGATIIIIGETFSICTILAGRYLATRRAYLFCLVIAALNCMHMPLGTALGVFTIIVLVRPGVKELFEQGEPGMA